MLGYLKKSIPDSGLVLSVLVSYLAFLSPHLGDLAVIECEVCDWSKMMS
jgi:hypothetical protein